MNLKNILKLNIVLFTLILILHIARIITNFEVKFMGNDIPLYVNYIAALITLVLISLNYKALKS